MQVALEQAIDRKSSSYKSERVAGRVATPVGSQKIDDDVPYLPAKSQAVRGRRGN